MCSLGTSSSSNHFQVFLAKQLTHKGYLETISFKLGLGDRVSFATLFIEV